MRLTLRTLLAHLDDVLDPQDSEQLKVKIKESNLASSLVERIRSGVIRKQLSSPPVDGKGLGGDANSVAEYLDNTLPMDRLPEFERICMESDMQLVEVAACHHILKEALGQHVAVSQELRSRLAGLEHLDAKELKGRSSSIVQRKGDRYVRLDDSHTAESASQQVTASQRVAVQPETIRGQGIDLEDDRIAERVPEYLRGRPSGRWRSALLTAGLVILLPIVAWQAIGSWSTLKTLLESNQVSEDKKPISDLGGLANPAEKDQAAQAVENVAAVIANLPTNAAAELPSNNSSPELNVEDVAKSGVVPGEFKNAVSGDSPVQPSSSVDATKVTPSTSVPNNGQGPIVARWMPESRESREAIVFASATTENYQNLHRLGTGDVLSAGSRVTIPPSYKTEFQLEPGIRWVVTSSTEFDLLPSSNGRANVRLHLARGMLSPTAKNSAIELQLDGDRSVRVQFSEIPSVIGIELRYFWIPGRDPNDPASIQSVFQLLGAEGNATCTFLEKQVALGSPVPIESTKAIAWIESDNPQAYEMKEIPWWLKSCYQRPIERYAAQELHSMLMPIEASQLKTKLHELVGYRRQETASLAARTLAMLGDYSSLFDGANALSNPRLRAHWPYLLEDVKQSASIHPSRLTSLQEYLRANDETKFALRWRQFTGYSSEQLSSGGGLEIYELLASNSQIDRALASQSLRAVLGSDRNYLPDNPSSEALQVLRKDLSDPKLNYRQFPVPVPELRAN